MGSFAASPSGTTEADHVSIALSHARVVKTGGGRIRRARPEDGPNKKTAGKIVRKPIQISSGTRPGRLPAKWPYALRSHLPPPRGYERKIRTGFLLTGFAEASGPTLRLARGNGRESPLLERLVDVRLGRSLPQFRESTDPLSRGLLPLRFAGGPFLELPVEFCRGRGIEAWPEREDDDLDADQEGSSHDPWPVDGVGRANRHGWLWRRGTRPTTATTIIPALAHGHPIRRETW